MSPTPNALALARSLIAFDTTNPPGSEATCARCAGDLLASAGFDVRYDEFAQGRTSVLATIRGDEDFPALGFTGHLDTVPLGDAPWTRDPFAGEVEDDRLYGRGASDMKAAVAAMMVAAIDIARSPRRRAGVVLALTAGEETCCEGADHLASAFDLRGRIGALVVGEPTSNRPVVAHKGAVRYRIAARGVSAHASMPEQGVNAIYRIARAVRALEAFDFGVAPHPLLGRPTLSVGTITGGVAINSVADRAEIGLDVRLIPGMNESEVLATLRAAVGDDVGVERIGGALSIDTSPLDPWIQRALAGTARVTGESHAPAGVPYFTDASVLTPAFGGVPTLILGPGEASMAHKTDESCSVSLLEQAVTIYTAIAADWCL